MGRVEKVIENEITFSKFCTRALTDKGRKLANCIRRKSGAFMEIFPSVVAKQRVVLRGLNEMVNKAEPMLNELVSSAVEISLSFEEIETLLRGVGEKNKCILFKIVQRILVPVSFLGISRKVVIFGNPEETKDAKEIFEEELVLIKNVLSSR